MTPNRNSFVLIILLTLLQCFAPLLHAHTFGIGQSGGVHLYQVAESHCSGSDVAHLQHLGAHEDEAPAIGMAQEYRQDSAIVLSDTAQALPVQSFRNSSRYETLPLDSDYVVPAASSSGHLIPFPQAPPQALI